jgi:hypothetical protein
MFTSLLSLHRRQYRVLEINATAARTGRHVLQLFAEATQSHHLSASRLEGAAASGAIDSDSADTILILFEEIDVVCQEDRGLFAALQQLCSTTKRPIVMTCNGMRH